MSFDVRNLYNWFGDQAEKVWINKRTRGFEKYYEPKPGWTGNVTPVLTDEEKAQIDEYFLKYYGEKIPYVYHNTYKYLSGKFDVAFFPDFLNSPHLMHFVNPTEFRKVMGDKNFFPLIAAQAGVKTAKSYVFNTRGIFFNENHEIISEDEAREIIKSKSAVFVKPTVDSYGGAGCFVKEAAEGAKCLTDKDADDIFSSFSAEYAVQQLVKNDSSISCMSPNSLNTFRIVTYIYKGKVYHTQAILRLGVNGARVDNASMGGIYVGVHEDGSLTDYAIHDEVCEKVYEHPNTHFKFAGYKLDGFAKVIEAAERMHTFIPELGIVDWDFALDDQGEAVLVEANVANGSGVLMTQCILGDSAFGENTPGILQFIAEAKKIPKSKREKMRLHL